MTTELENVLATLKLEELEYNLYRGRSPQVGWQRIYGGQVIGQSLMAAIKSVDESRPIHSLHGYFLRPGDPTIPIIYHVHRDRDGKSFSSRRVVAVQHGKSIFTMSASFHNRESGFNHQFDMPDVPAPEDLPDEKTLFASLSDQLPENLKKYFTRERPIEIRLTQPEHFLNPQAGPPEQHIWMRATGPIADDPALHQCMLAYASDMTLLDTALIAHGRNLFDQSLMMASLDHAMWFCRPFKANDWLLFAQDSPSAHGGRGLTRGNFFNRSGELIASVAQEGMIRQRRAD